MTVEIHGTASQVQTAQQLIQVTFFAFNEFCFVSDVEIVVAQIYFIFLQFYWEQVKYYGVFSKVVISGWISKTMALSEYCSHC